MNKRTDQEELLADVLAGESSEGFNAALLDETLRHARRRRHWRQARRHGGVIALPLLAGFAGWQAARSTIEPKEITRLQPIPAGYQLVISQPLSVTQLVDTQPMVAESVITLHESVAQISTRIGGFREVGDDELLTLAEPQVAALVRRGPHEAELVFVPPPETAVQ